MENNINFSKNNWKPVDKANPITSNVFCADPTAVEYEGRLYVYGTNDHQQYLNAEKNTYEKIKSLVCFSTDDMVNWTYHGEINVEKIEPWIFNSWAPSVCSRIEKDGLTHFYLYFSNSGCGVGVITATNPLGPWSDPLGKPLIFQGMPGLNSPAPFDPGVCIDDKGTGWLAFGGGVVEGRTRTMPGSSKIVKLGPDMISLESDFVDLKAPHFFEASEMNFVNGTYIYTFNTDWEDRSDWPLEGTEPASRCSMAYMTTKTPLDSESWVYKKHYFKNPGDMGLHDSNNHTHFEKYKNQWYLFYHTLTLQEKAGTEGGFRSLCAEKLNFDEEKAEIGMTEGTRGGLSPIKNLDPYSETAGTTIFTSADIWYEDIENPSEISAESVKEGAWILVKNADFESKAPSEFTAVIKGKGFIEVRLDDIESDCICKIKIEAEDFTKTASEIKNSVKGVHDLYILFSEKDICLKKWNFN